MRIFSLGVIGGRRGKYLAEIAIKTGRAKIIAFVDTDKEKRDLLKKEFSCEVFSNWQEIFLRKVEVDGIIIASPPCYHTDMSCAFLKKGIPVYLEKPMATNLQDARKILKAVQKTKTPLQTGFNCRYAPFWVKIKDIVSSGKIGEIISMEWKEVISPYHWSTYCRWPSYKKKAVIGSWLLEKTCHDLDLMNWFTESKCIRVSSFGSRSHFKPRKELPKYCSKNCPIEKECIFSAFKFYPGLEKRKEVPDYELLCVYNSCSDLVDHQSSILEYENGITCCFSLMPLIQEKLQSRFIYICGTEATLIGDWTKNQIRVYPHRTKDEIVEDIVQNESGHGGGDSLIISDFLNYLENPNKKPKTTEKEGWEAMVIGCGIDKALMEKKVISLRY